jgi:hypothetical protein
VPGGKFKIHRAVIYLQSKPLAAAVAGKFKARPSHKISKYHADHNRRLSLARGTSNNYKHDVVANMLSYLYIAKYDDGEKAEPVAPLLIGLSMMAMCTITYRSVDITFAPQK